MMMILAVFLHVRDQITSSHIVLQSNTYIFFIAIIVHYFNPKSLYEPDDFQIYDNSKMLLN